VRAVEAKKVGHLKNYVGECSSKGGTGGEGTKIELEFDELIKNAESQPGIADLMFVYGQYAETLQKSHEYLEGVKPKV
jgi:hypothetical protein